MKALFAIIVTTIVAFLLTSCAPDGFTRAEDGTLVPDSFYEDDDTHDDIHFAGLLCSDWPDRAPEACAALTIAPSAQTARAVFSLLD